MHRRRCSNGFGPEPISSSDMMARSLLLRLDYQPWQVELFEKLDELFLSVHAKRVAAEKEGGESLRSSAKRDGIGAVLGGMARRVIRGRSSQT